MRLALLLGLPLLAPSALAGRGKEAPVVPPNQNVVYSIPGLLESLQARGWSPTPEQSSGIQVGDIRHVSDPGLFLKGSDCFPGAEPRTGAQVDASIVQKLKAGGSVRLGVARASADGFQYKQSTIAEPYTEEFDLLALERLSEQCRSYVAKRDPQDWQVVTAVLSAQVVERLCRSLEGGLRLPGGSAQVGGAEECVAESDGHVAIAYKTRSMTWLIGSGPPSPQGPEAPPDLRLDLSGQRAEQRCAEQAATVARIAAEQVLEAEQLRLQRQAAEAWARLEGPTQECLELAPARRGDCTRVVTDFVRWASGLRVELAETRVDAQTDCGPRPAAVEAQRGELHLPALEAAQDRLAQLQQQTVTRAASGRDYSASGSTMLWIPAGTFTMGCTEGQAGRCEPDEGPAHTVHISEGFWLDQTETSQRQWREVMGSPHASASASCGERCPVVSLSWCEAVTFANARSRKEGLQPAYLLPWGPQVPIGPRCAEEAQKVQWERSASGYRLPTEAEWEYAARAGVDSPYSGGAEPGALAWYDANGAHSTHPGGQKAANAWGLHDMSGNAWEWVWDAHSGYGPDPLTDPSGPAWGGDRVKRGGGYSSQPTRLRVSLRDPHSPQVVSDSLGFRLARGATGMQPYAN